MRKYIPKFQPGGTTKSSAPSAGAKIEKQQPDSLATKLKFQEPLAKVNNSLDWKNNIKDPGLAPRTELSSEKSLNKTRNKSNNSLKAGNGIGISSDAVSNTSKAVSMISDVAQNFVEVDEGSNFQGQQAIGDALMSSGNPYAMAAGAAFKALSVIGEATGTNVSTINEQQASSAGLSKGQRMLNNVLGYVPMLGAAGTKTNKATEMTDETRQLSSAFGGSVEDISTASAMGGNRYLFGGSKINSLIDKANRDNKLFTEMSKTNTQRKQSDYGQDLAQQNINRYAGNTYNSNRIGKHGLKLMSVAEIKQLLESRKESEIQSFQNGGVIGVDVNVIAEGKYHAHKNHLSDVSEELSDLTKKGIPVITHSEGGEIEQVAEIEKKELIFRLEVTNRLEELFKDGSEEAMIEAGKLVAEEIIENTQDNSGEVLNNE